jgi:hypothetical protein
MIYFTTTYIPNIGFLILQPVLGKAEIPSRVAADEKSEELRGENWLTGRRERAGG